jgi:hypothetical protein
VYGFPDPQVGNTLTKYGTLCLMAFLMANREALREKLFRLILIPYCINLVCSALWLIFGDINGNLLLNLRTGGTTTVDWYFMVNVFVDIIFLGALMLGLAVLNMMAVRHDERQRQLQATSGAAAPR